MMADALAYDYYSLKIEIMTIRKNIRETVESLRFFLTVKAENWGCTLHTLHITLRGIFSMY